MAALTGTKADAVAMAEKTALAKHAPATCPQKQTQERRIGEGRGGVRFRGGLRRQCTCTRHSTSKKSTQAAQLSRSPSAG